MTVLKGRAISPGFADGVAVVHGAAPAEVPSYRVHESELDAELERFQVALREAAYEIERLQEWVAAELGEDQAEIFDAHLAFLRDPQFSERVWRQVVECRVNVEQAVDSAVREVAGALAAADNEYLREREADVRDLGRRVLRQLARHQGRRWSGLPAHSVLVVHELLPSDLLDLDRSRLAAVVTEQGGEAGHAAILARSLGIPGVTGVTGATRHIAGGARVLVDGQRGEIAVEPEPRHVQGFLERKRRYEQAVTLALAEEKRECVTPDQVSVHLYANIGRPDEAAEVIPHHLDGVGLFRTEYLFLEAARPPERERQQAAYREAVEHLAGRPLVIRTVDLGGDKRPAFLARHFEANPNLGMRGLRFCLAVAPELFRTQLDALLETANKHDIRILLPMVLGGADLQQALAIVRETAAARGMRALPPVGALVETPAAVFAIDDILEHADFVSLGTNDLTQFILAADRNALEVIEDYTILHPGVLRAVKQVVDAARRRAKTVSVCGEAAGDPGVAALLVGLGVRHLSMSPVLSPRVRYTLLNVECRALERLASQALTCQSPDEVRELVASFTGIPATDAPLAAED